MKEERESGFIDKEDNFIFKKELQEVDVWVAGLDESALQKTIEEAALAERRRLQKRTAAEAVRNALDAMSPIETVQELVKMMHPGETVARSLRRLSGREDHASEGMVNRRRPKESGLSTPAEIRPAALSRSSQQVIDRFTELTDKLVGSGITDLFSTSYESLRATYTKWEYLGADGVLYGPFTSKQIVDWRKQGFFTGSTAVMMREVQIKSMDEHISKRIKSDSESATATSSEENSEWRSSDEIEFGIPIAFSTEGDSSIANLKSRTQKEINLETVGRPATVVQNDDSDSDDEDDADDGFRKRGTRASRLEGNDDDD